VGFNSGVICIHFNSKDYKHSFKAFVESIDNHLTPANLMGKGVTSGSSINMRYLNGHIRQCNSDCRQMRSNILGGKFINLKDELWFHSGSFL